MDEKRETITLPVANLNCLPMCEQAVGFLSNIEAIVRPVGIVLTSTGKQSQNTSGTSERFSKITQRWSKRRNVRRNRKAPPRGNGVRARREHAEGSLSR